MTLTGLIEQLQKVHREFGEKYVTHLEIDLGDTPAEQLNGITIQTTLIDHLAGK